MTISEKKKLEDSINRRVAQVETLVKDGRALTTAEDILVENLLDDIEEDRETLLRVDRKPTPVHTKAKSDDTQKLTRWQLKIIERLALGSFLRHGVVPEQVKQFMPQFRAAQGSAGSAGGFLIPEGFQNELETATKSFSGMWESADIWRTERGNITPWSFSDDTNHKGYLVSESADISSGAQSVVFGKQQFEGYKYTSGLIQVPIELIDDSDIFANEFVRLLSERIGRATNEVFTTGSGVNRPRGILTSATYGGSTSDDAALTYNDFVNLKFSVDVGYRKSNKCYWMMHNSVLKEVTKIKDGQNLPIFQHLDEGIMLGHQVIVNNDLPEFAPGSTTLNDNDKVVLFGDFSKYKIRTVKSMRIVRLQGRYGDQDQIGFAVLFRVDGDLMDAGRHPVKYLRVATT